MEDSQSILVRFNRLMREVQNGVSTRTCFLDWEVDLLLDMQACNLGELNRRRVLQRYRRAVERRLEKGATRPLKLSEYLAHTRLRRPRPEVPPPAVPVAGAA